MDLQQIHTASYNSYQLSRYKYIDLDTIYEHTDKTNHKRTI